MTGPVRTFRTTGLVMTAALLASLGTSCATSEEVPGGGDGGVTGTGGFSATGGVTATGGFGTSTGGFNATGGVRSTTGGSSSTATGGASSTGGGAATGGSKPFGTGGVTATGGVTTTAGSTGVAGGTVGGQATTGGAGGAGGGSTAGASSAGAAGGPSDGCNWAACTMEQCSIACPTNMGNYCAMACAAIIACYRMNPTCGTASDPLCVNRSAGSGTANVCTPVWESGGGSSTSPGAPAAVAVNYFECACGIDVPGSGTTGTGGKSGVGGSAGTTTGGAAGKGGSGG